MGLYLIGTVWPEWLMYIWIGIQVAVGLGMVIFVHELGHFLVAKWCGVKCLKFYLGFDFFGWRFCEFQWGETKYGIGVFPLGGYVKMLGQDDNPGAQAEADKQAANGEAPTYDPRDYRAKSVPQRMAIISAGVVMNVIFAFLITIWAFLHGVHAIPCEVSNVLPGSPAWEAGIQLGDRMLEIGDRKNPYFRDLKREVVLGDPGDSGIPFVIQREGREDPIRLTITPEKSEGSMPIIGVSPARRNEVSDTIPHLPASDAMPEFKEGDRIVRVGDEQVEDYDDMALAFARQATGTLQVVVERKEKEGDKEKTKTIPITVRENPLKRLGLLMAMSPITGIQRGSPAEKAGLQKGDFIEQVNGQSVRDPATLPQQMYQLAGETVTLSVKRDGKSMDIEVVPEPSPALIHLPQGGDQPLDVPALGIAYRLLNRVKDIDEEVLAKAIPDKSKKSLEEYVSLLKDKVIVSAKVVLPDGVDSEELVDSKKTFEFGEDKTNWAYFALYYLQFTHPDSTVQLQVKNGESVTLKLAKSSEYGFPNRGLIAANDFKVRRANSFGEAVFLAYDSTLEAVTEVFSVLQKMVAREVPMENIGGPIRIFGAAGQSARMGFGDLLLFLALLSANLAVINFLPIPVLDGGHMVFLTWELIRGKPANEQVLLYLHMAGFLFIICLVVLVLTMDVTWLVGN